MLRTHTCGELRLDQVGLKVILCGWIQRIRDKGSIIWIDLRDRYGITQLLLEEGETAPKLIHQARTLGREYVVQVHGIVTERVAKNKYIPTGEIELQMQELVVLNAAKTPPFLIESVTDGGEELRMKYRYLDLRRDPLKNNLLLRHQVMQHARAYLAQHQFIEIETPILIKATPEGARDFVVPARIHPGQFYALPQSPQICKQLLMVAGVDRYYQMAKCFRDEDLRADRQPEFTQIDCELSFVTQEDVIGIFEGFIQFLFGQIKNHILAPFPRITYREAIQKYGTDKPDLRFEMSFVELTQWVQGQGVQLLDTAGSVIGICAPGCADYTRKQLDQLRDFVRETQRDKPLFIYVKYHQDGKLTSSVDKFYSPQGLVTWARAMQAHPGDLLLILAGETVATRHALSELRLKLGKNLNLRDSTKIAPVWIVDFPLLAWDKTAQRYQAKHHPFTAPQEEDITLLATQPEAVRGCSYDLVINGLEIGGGSIRIHERSWQEKIFKLLGFSEAEAQQQFGFLMDALEYGAPPHGGIALGLDRLCALLGDEASIRSCIAFPKNNAGRDIMLQAPSPGY